MNRLNGWQRIGVVLSVAWALVIGALGALEYAQNGDPTYYFVDTKKVDVPQPKDMYRPGRLLSDEEFLGYRLEHRFSLLRLVAAMFIPIAAVWCITCLGILIVRWVAAGFKRNGT